MYTINELKLGNVQNEINRGGQHLFVIAREENTLVYHAKAASYHDYIPRNGVPESDVVGGGVLCIYQFVPNELQFGGDSGQFEEIPNELIEMYSSKILKLYQEKQPQLEKVVVDLDGKDTLDGWLFNKDLELNL
jgi:hypothetical protein